MTNISDKFWDLGNIIVGFSVVQTISTIIYVGGHKGQLIEFLKQFGILPPILMIFVFFLLYILSIFLCFRAEIKIRKEFNESKLVLSVCKKVMYGRLITVVLFHIVGIGTLIYFWLECLNWY